MPALQKKHKKSSVHNIKSVMNTRYGELHQKRYFRKLRQSKGFRPQAGGFAHAFFTFLGCFECNQKRYFLIFINDESSFIGCFSLAN